MLAAVDSILASAKRPPIIIIQSDHGPGSCWDEARVDRSDERERLSILNAFYFPDRRYERLRQEMTPVNTFRIILDQYFGWAIRCSPTGLISSGASRTILRRDREGPRLRQLVSQPRGVSARPTATPSMRRAARRPDREPEGHRRKRRDHGERRQERRHGADRAGLPEVERPPECRHAVGQRIDLHQPSEPRRGARGGKERSGQQPDRHRIRFMMA